eukprot:TRINITY_DN5891_c0_g1_i1.p1 TRINITY_DN5891_c0_g1~~TRINITY_DN5891_c0_g1_i1.p1  ORF type:complete len:1710 (-),score=686.20 TRINITY_DN5891_c0_g1_i1:133-4821(-)
MEDNDQKERELEFSANEVNDLRKRVLALNAEKQQVEKQLIAATTKNTPLVYEVETLREVKTALEGRLEMMAADSEETSKQYWELKKELLAEKQKLELDIHEVRLRCKNAEEKAAGSEKRLKEMMETIASREEELGNVRRELQKVKEDHDISVNRWDRRARDLDSIITEKERRIEELKENGRSMQDRLARAKEALQDKDAEWEKQRDEFVAQIRSLENKIAISGSRECQDVVADSSKTKEEIVTQWIEAEKRASTLLKENEMLKAELTYICEEIDARAPVVAEQRRDFERLAKSHDQLVQQLTSLEEDFQKTRRELKSWKQKSYELESAYKTETFKSSDLGKQVQMLLCEIEKAERRAEASGISEEMQQSEKEENEDQFAFKNVEELQKKNESLRVEVFHLSEKLANVRKSVEMSLRTQFEAELARANSRVEVLEKDARAIEEKLRRERDHYMKVAAELKKNSAALPDAAEVANLGDDDYSKETLEREYEEATKQLSEERNRRNSLEIELERTRREKQYLETQYSIMRDLSESARADSARYQKLYEEKQRTLEDMATRVSDTHVTIMEKERKIKEYEGDLHTAQRLLAMKEVEIKRYQEELGKFSVERTQILEMRRLVGQIAEENGERSKEQLQRLTMDVETLETQLHETRENLHSSRNFASELEARVSSLKKENESLLRKVEDQVSAHEDELKAWKTRCANSEERVEKLETDLKESRDRLMSLLQDSLGDVESVHRGLQRDLDEARMNYEFSEKEVASQAKRIEQLVEMWNEEKKRADDLSWVLHNRSEEMDALRLSEQVAQEQLRDMQTRSEEEKKEAKTKISSLEEEIRGLEEVVQSLRSQLEREEDLVQHAQQWKDAHDAEVIARGKDHQRIKELDDSNAQLKERFNESEKSRELLEIEMNKVREENMRLSEEIARQVENMSSLPEHHMEKMEEDNEENIELLPPPTAEEARELREEIRTLRIRLGLAKEGVNEKAETIVQLQRRIVELEEQKKDLRDRLQSMQSPSSFGQEEGEWRKDMERQMNILNESNLHLRERNKDLSVKAIDLKKEVDDGKKAVMDAKRISSEMERRIEVLEEEKKQIEGRAEKFREKLHNLLTVSNTVSREEHDKALAKVEERVKSAEDKAKKAEDRANTAEKDCADAKKNGRNMIELFRKRMEEKDKAHKEQLERELAGKDGEISSFSLKYLREMKKRQELEKRLNDVQHEFALFKERCTCDDTGEGDRRSRKRGVEAIEEQDDPSASVSVSVEEEEVHPPSKRKKMAESEEVFVEEMNRDEEPDVPGVDDGDDGEAWEDREEAYFQPEGDDAGATAGVMESLASDGIEGGENGEDEIQDSVMEENVGDFDGGDGINGEGDENVEEQVMDEEDMSETMMEDEGHGDEEFYSPDTDGMVEQDVEEGEEYGEDGEAADGEADGEAAADGEEGLLGDEEVEEEGEREEREMEIRQASEDGPSVRQIQRPELDDIGIPIPPKIKRSIFDDDGTSAKPFSTFVPAASREKTEEEIRKSRQARFAEGSARPPPRHKMLSESLPGLPTEKKPQPQGKETEEKKEDEDKP